MAVSLAKPDLDNVGRPIDADEVPAIAENLRRHLCPVATEFGVKPGVVILCGLPAAPHDTWCREHLFEYGVGE